MENSPINHDARWKELITILFKDFVAFFLPHIYLRLWTKSRSKKIGKTIASSYL